jgi:hypothetical protein
MRLKIAIGFIRRIPRKKTPEMQLARPAPCDEPDYVFAYNDLHGMRFFVQPENWRCFEHDDAQSISLCAFYAMREMARFWAL